MVEGFPAKLTFALKALSLSRGKVAAALGVDKSAVGRWAAGAATPMSHNLAGLSALVATRVPGFSILDWDRDLDALAGRFGVEADGVAGVGGEAGLPLAFLDQILANTRLRGRAYEGFFRSTRPYAQHPGSFIHDQVIIRLGASGLLGFEMGTGGVLVEGSVLPLQNQLFVIGSEMTSGSLVFGIFNAVSTVKAGVLDGLALVCALDPGRTPTASGMVLERTGELSDDAEADRRHFLELASLEPVAPDGSIDPSLSAHLAPDVGPAQVLVGGDWLLRLPIAHSLSRGLTPQ